MESVVRVKQNEYKGKRVFVIASGPSLRGADLSWLKDDITICVNESYKLLPFDPTFICIGDYKLWPHVREEYAKKNSKIICSSGLDGTCGEGAGKNLAVRVPLLRDKHIKQDGFSFDLPNGVPLGWNVITEIVLPFVCWAGFDECVLMGCDCTDGGYAYSESSLPKNQRFDGRAMEAYQTIAKTQKPTVILNGTFGGNLNYFPRINLLEKFHRPLLFVGYYTSNNDYKTMAERMKASVEEQGQECEIYEMPNLAQPEMKPPLPWVLNCSQCATFIKRMRKRHPGKDLFYLDADAVMVRRPSLFLDYPRGYDFGVVFLTNEYTKNQLSSNSMYFAATDKADELIDRWEKEQFRRIAKIDSDAYASPFKEVWDQKVLQDVLPKVRGLKYIHFPYEYGKLTLTPKGEELMPTVDPDKIVIEQYQASRWNKWTKMEGKKNG